MKKNKNKKLGEFLANQELFLVIFLAFVFLIMSLPLLYDRYKSLDLLSAGYLEKTGKVVETIDPETLRLMEEYKKKLASYEAYIKDNFSEIAPSDSVGLVIDNISFVGPNRALIFYHDTEKGLISEVVMDFNDEGLPKVVKNYLKNSNGHDYSNGVYGADPG
jgi:hypothetical protein